jgi:hypothetical protein
MKRGLLSLMMLVVISSGLVTYSQTPTSKQSKRKAPGIQNLIKRSVRIQDLAAVVKSRSSLVTQAAYYANMPDHGARPPGNPAPHPAVQSRTINGVTYRLQTTPFSEEPAPNPSPAGASRTETSSDHKRVCTAVPSRHVRVIDTMREYGGTAENLVPGMIFTAQSVLDGTFNQMNVNRRPFSITTGLVDYSKPPDQNTPVKPVAAPYNLGSINTALANLQNAMGQVQYPNQLFGETFAIHSTAGTKLDFQAKASANLAMAGIPADVAVGSGFSNSSNLDYSQVAAVITNPFFTVSVSEMPWELVNGTPPADAVLLKAVVYGRLGIFKARSKMQSGSLAVNVDAAVTALEGAASASAEFDSLFTSSSNETSSSVAVVGGPPPGTGAGALDSFADFKAAFRNLSPTVAGGFGVPIAYVFRYLSDDARVLIQGTADYGVVECEPLSRLKVSGLLDVTFVDDYPPDEEIYGTIKMTVAGVEKTLWSRSSSTFVRLGSSQSLPFPDGATRNWNSNISTGEEVVFDVRKGDINGGVAKIVFAINDRIDGPLEAAGATPAAKKNGFVTFAPGERSIQLRDILESQGQKKEIIYPLEEVGPGKGALRVAIRLRLVD